MTTAVQDSEAASASMTDPQLASLIERHDHPPDAPVTAGAPAGWPGERQ